MEIIGKLLARELGLKRYFTGEPCNMGHVSERYVSTGNCIECINNGRNASVNVQLEIDRIQSLLDTLPARHEKRLEAIRAEQYAELRQYENRLASLRNNLNSMVTDQTRDELARKVATKQAALSQLKTANIVVEPQDVETVKALLVAYTLMLWPGVSNADLWLSKAPRKGVIYQVRYPAAQALDIERAILDIRKARTRNIAAQALAYMSATASENTPAVTTRNVGIDETFK